MEDIDILKNELDKQKIENANLKNELEIRINDDEKEIFGLKKVIEKLKESINSNMSQKDLKDNKLEDINKEINQIKEENKKINNIIDNMAQIIDGNIIKFEKDEIKNYLSIEEEGNKFKIDNIKITNIGNKKFENLYFVIDTDISSKNLLLEKGNTYYKLSLNRPFSKGQNLNNYFYLYMKNQKIGEYNIFIHVREKPDGLNLSSPLKITVNTFKYNERIKRFIEKNLNIENKYLDKKKVYLKYEEFEEEFNLSSLLEEEEIIKKIIECNCDKNELVKWIEDAL